ncbi:MAG TPA: hypothetical protein VHQ65_11540, partial [Thermoanaerobaculia bacterium]|nr:hypothetical protein [Thermoanaerobaculia bacterium]
MASRRTAWSWLGRVGYAAGTALQERLRDDVRFGRGPEHLLLLEHPPVYTLGRNAGRADVLLGDDELASRGIA